MFSCYLSKNKCIFIGNSNSSELYSIITLDGQEYNFSGNTLPEGHKDNMSGDMLPEDQEHNMPGITLPQLLMQNITVRQQGRYR